MSSTGFAYWTIFWRNFSNGFLRIFNNNEYKSEKHKEISYDSKSFYMILKCITIFVNSVPYFFLGNTIWTLFILDITISDYLNFKGYIRKIFYFGLNRIQIPRFFKISKKLSYLSIFSLLFSKKELKSTKKPNKITTQKIFTNTIITISSIIFILLFIINIDNFEKLYKRKQQLSLLKVVAKFLKNPKNYPIVSLLSFRLNDNEIICNVGLGCENESIDQGRSYVDKNIDISNCFFSRSSSYSGDGGVIYVSASSCSMNINYSMFYNCDCSSYGGGGAIYFISSNSSLRMICANSCSCGASYVGHFAYVVASQVNQVEYLSVSNCSHTTSGYYPICFESGNQRVDNTNSSMNNAYWVSGFGISSPSSFTSSHCTFSNNKVSEWICIWFYSDSGTISMSYANIVHNNSPYNGVVYVWGAGSRKMMYCIFKNNQNTLFCVYEGSLEVSHSFIDHSGSSFSSRTAVSTSNNNSFTNIITYQLQFFNSIHCNADIPLPQRTPDQSPTPKSTPEVTPMNTPEETPMNTAKETPYRSYDESSDNKSNSVFVYSTVGMFLIIVVMISYNIGSQRNKNQNMNDRSSSSSSSSSLEMKKKHKREEKYDGNDTNKDNDSKRDHQKNHHHDYVSSPYVF